jgi:hypothetical protein
MSRDNIYFNAVINPDPNQRLGTIAKFNQNLTIPLLLNPSEYYCTVVRFQLPINNIPLFKFPVDRNQNNPLVSKLVLGISYLGTKYPEYVNYIADNTYTAPTPGASAPYFSSLQAGSNFYDVFSIRAMLNMFNVTLATAITAAGCGGTAVYSYNEATQIISLTASQSLVTSTATIFMNDAAFNFVNSFRMLFNTTPTVEDDYYHIFNPLPPLVSLSYTFVEDYSAMSLWFDLRKITLVSNSMPIAYESVPTLVDGQATGVTSAQAILTDFVVGLDNVSDVSTVAVYNPSAQYRLIDCTGHTPLVNIDLAFFYTDKFGNTFPVTIDPSQTASVKLAFLRKSLYINK